ncbi:MAG: metallophosphoesterase [Mariniphaga sp.]
MFHLMITLVYIVPNIYVCLRIMQLFINKRQRFKYLLVYLLFALVYPVSNLFGQNETGFLASAINEAGGYLLTFYLYLFLSLLVFELILLINLIFRVMPFERLKEGHNQKIVLSVLLGLSAMVVIGGIINFNTIQVSEYRILVPRKSAKIEHLRIAFVADFHLKEETNVRFVERFVKKVEGLNPDLMLYGGDIVEGNRHNTKMEDLENLLGQIHPRYGVYGVLGNHEYYGGQDKGNFFDKAGINILLDTNALIDSSFNLMGRYDSHFNRRKAIDDLMKQVNDSFPTILLDHRPTELEQVSKTAVDIQLSGHTHNGQMFPLSLIIQSMYQLSWGYEKIGNTHFFVTSGIRLWGPPVRTVGKSEIMIIDVDFVGE